MTLGLMRAGTISIITGMRREIGGRGEMMRVRQKENCVHDKNTFSIKLNEHLTGQPGMISRLDCRS